MTNTKCDCEIGMCTHRKDCRQLAVSQPEVQTTSALRAAEKELIDLARPISSVFNRSTKQYEFTDDHIKKALPGTFQVIEQIRAALAIPTAAQGGLDREKVAHAIKENTCAGYADDKVLGIYQATDAILALGGAAQAQTDCDTVPVARWWIKHVQDQMLQMKLPSGPVGDFIFIFREQLGDLLNKASSVPSADREGK